MQIVDKLMAKLGYEKSIGPLIGDHTIFKSLRQLLYIFAKGKVTQPYRQSVWTYACINAIAENIAQVPFKLRKDAGNLEPDTIESGELYDLFQSPNPLMNCFDDLIKATFIFYCLRGEAFWIMEGRTDITKPPKEIWTFDPSRFEPVTDKNTGMLLGWKYKGLSDVYLSVNEVLQFKMFNPYDDIRGLAPVEAASLSIDQNYQSGIYNKAFFENGATVGGYISIPEELSDESFTRLVKQFEDRHKGADKAHRIAIVEGGGKFTPARMTQKDMEFIECKRMTKEEILAVFKVNPVVLGDYSQIKSYEGIKSAHKAFWEECLVPKITYFENVLWIKFFSKVGQRRGKGRVWGQFDLANVGSLLTNYKEKIAIAKDMFFMGWPINHINKRLGLGMKEVPWGEEWWVPGGYSSVNMLTGNQPSKPAPKKVEEPTDDEKKELITFYCEPIESDFQNKFKKILFETRKRTIGCVINQCGWEEAISEKELLKLKQSLSEIYVKGVQLGISAIQCELGCSIEMNDNQNIVDYKESRSKFISENFKILLENVVRNLSENRTNDDKVREVFNLLASKMNAVSKSESESSFNFGKQIALNSVKKTLAPSLEWADKMGERVLLN